MYTVRIPEDPAYYLRPLTILETRALAHSLMWILYVFDFDETSKNDVLLYLQAFYNSVTPDYRFILDLFSKAGGKNRFIDFMKESEARQIYDFLDYISAICWYSLQAQAISEGDATFFPSSPVFRLMYALKFLEGHIHEAIKNPQNILTIQQLYNYIDKRANEASVQFVSERIEDTLQSCLERIAQIRGTNNMFNKNPKLQAHFQSIFNLQEQIIRSRISHGYKYKMALFDEEFINSNFIQELTNAYMPDETVVSWFAFIYDFTYKFFQRPEDIKYAERELRKIADVSSQPLVITNYTLMYFVEGDEFYKDKVAIIVDDALLLSRQNDRDAIDIEVADLNLGTHSFLKIKMTSILTKKSKEFIISICPFRIRQDAGYQFHVDKLLFKQSNGDDKKLDERWDFLIMSSSYYEILTNSELTPKERFKQLKDNGLSIYKNPVDLSETRKAYALTLTRVAITPSYKIQYCPYCKNLQPKRSKRADNLLINARKLSLQGKNEEAIKLCDDVLHFYPNDDSSFTGEGHFLV